MAQLVLREKIYVPVDDPEELIPLLDLHYTVDVFKEQGCEPCEFRDARPTDECGECPNYLARKKLWKHEVKKEQDYIGFPYGKKSLIPRIVPKVKSMGVRDLRPRPMFETKLRFTGELRPHQQEAIDLLVEYEEDEALRGILKAPARSGKTVCAVALACTLKVRTLILANTHDLCMQFYKTCVGGDNQPALTNAPALSKKGVTSVVLADKVEDFYQGDIVIATYQKFISEIGAERLKEIESLFGLLIIDEVQRAPATSFLKVVATLNTFSKLGLTATVGRKDGMDILTQYVLGPVLHKIKIETLVPKVVFHESGLFPKKDYSNWTYFCRWLERSDERTCLIIEQVMKDLKAKRSIIIPCTFTSQIHELVRRINWEYGRDIAAAVVGGSTKREKERREDILEKAREGKIRVVVGTRSIINTGINVTPWDTIYTIVPISNPPQWIQEYSRVLTPMEGKKPIIRMWLDGSSQTRGCLRTCLFSTEGDTPTLAKQAIISPEDWAIANKYLKKGKMSVNSMAQDVGKTTRTKGGRIAL